MLLHITNFLIINYCFSFILSYQVFEKCKNSIKFFSMDKHKIALGKMDTRKAW